MLITEMLLYLRSNTSESQFKSYKDLLPFLHELNPTGFEFSLRQFISFNDEFVTIDNIAQFNNSLLQLIMEEVENFGVYISELQPVADKLPLFSKMLRALYRVDQYEDLVSLKYLLDSSHDSKETVAEILVLMDGSLTVESIMEMVQDVSPSLISRIRDFIADLDYSFSLNEPGVDPLFIERIRNALTFYGIEKAKRYFVEVGGAGEPIDNYLNYFFSDLVTHTPEELAKLSLFSGIAANLPLVSIKKRLGDLVPFYITDTELLIKVTRQINKLALPEAINDQA